MHANDTNITCFALGSLLSTLHYSLNVLCSILRSMEHIVVGLGNPGEEYADTRHNVGRMVVAELATALDASDWRDDKKLRARVAQATLENGDKVTLVLPDNYMNRSGASVAPLITSTKKAERLVVVHDDIDLPFGALRIVFNRGAGGHNGVLSIERALKTRAFVRVRVGVIPTTPGGKLKKPTSGEALHDFILKGFTKKERDALGEVLTRSVSALRVLLTEGRDAAQCAYNS